MIETVTPLYMTTPPPSEFDWIARVLHFSDSALPVGAYAHSFGLEGVCQMGIVHDKETLRRFLKRDVTTALTHIDLPLTAHAHDAAIDGNTKLLKELDQLSFALRPTRQLREAASRIGRQQANIYSKTWAGFEEMDLPHQQSPIVLGALYAQEKAPVMAALWSMAYQTFSALLQAALKLLPIGPAATQEILHDALKNISSQLELAKNLPLNDIGSFNPIWDIAASQHEHTAARLFIS
ncbi:MAG: urease accessory protein UreF [Akkermansiaceae bacterium]